ncbi:MAG: LTA synthase family protein [Tildeniella torsiva UHER 1998/13D]|jgi:hypothetical protein|nr:LTA synthase family protein [Tildeniella torsiva UHER 1998/13D]
MKIPILLEVCLPILGGVILSFFIEGLLKNGVHPFWKRDFSVIFIHLGVWLALFSSLLLMSQRPWFSMFFLLTFMFFLVQVSNAKFRVLKEPLIVQDFDFLFDALKHPRLFLPFLGLVRASTIILFYTISICTGVTLENSLTDKLQTYVFVALVSILLFVSLILLLAGSIMKNPLQFNPERDLQQLGLIASMWRYAQEESTTPHLEFSSIYEHPKLYSFPATLPNLVVVQSESFFDARRLFYGIEREVLKEFEILKSLSVCQGRLQVPTVGANTVRTEFSFLSGLNNESLGIHRFNPYRKIAQKSIPTLVSYLKKIGYKTVCVHPYDASFYNRNKVFPLLGFGEFIDISSFMESKKEGPYISDITLAEKVCALLDDSSNQPIFIFVISMENHGPLQLEKISQSDAKEFYSHFPPDGCKNLTIYLRHLRNADRMLGMLREKLSTLSSVSWLCWYGDHLPMMPRVYEIFNVLDKRTDYLIWNSRRDSGHGTEHNTQVDNLGYLLLQKMNLLKSYL